MRLASPVNVNPAVAIHLVILPVALLAILPVVAADFLAILLAVLLLFVEKRQFMKLSGRNVAVEKLIPVINANGDK